MNDAFDLALGESGRLQHTPEPMPLRETMDDIQAEWQAARPPPARRCWSPTDGDPELGVMCDRGRMRQVFANLIAAAVKTTRQGAVEASLKARVLPEGVRLEGRVRDAGPGLPPELLARIFEPSAQGEDAARVGWRGLGLPLARLVVEAMGGSIRAEGNVGEGVTVTFEMMAPRLETVAETASSGLTSQGGSIHVLVVETTTPPTAMVAEGLCEMFDCTSECARGRAGGAGGGAQRPFPPDPDGHQDAPHGRDAGHPRDPRAAGRRGPGADHRPDRQRRSRRRQDLSRLRHVQPWWRSRSSPSGS